MEKEVKVMEIGGNKKFLEFLKRHRIKKPNYSGEECVIYKKDLQEQLNQLYGVENSEEKEIKVVEEPKK